MWKSIMSGLGLSCQLVATMQQTVIEWEKQEFFKNASLGIYISKENEKEPLIDHHGKLSLLPSSIVKLLTTAVSLEKLGPSFTFSTFLKKDGEMKEGILDGNLILEGSGDPTLGSDRFEGVNQTLLLWTQAVQKRGIVKIKGDIVVDASCFKLPLAPQEWLCEDVGNYYGASICGVNFHENYYTLTFDVSSAPGKIAPLLNVSPKIKGLDIQSSVRVGAKDSGDQAYVHGGEFASMQYVDGTLPHGKLFSIKASIPNPAKFCGEVLKKALEDKGIKIEGEVIVLFTPYISKGKEEILHEKRSKPLLEVLEVMNQVSINLYAESLIKVIGRGSHKEGVAILRDYVRNLGVPLEGITLVDGSGLSRKNSVTAEGMVSFLKNITRKPYFNLFLATLNEGSSRRVKDIFPLNNVYLKTGLSSQNETYLGYFINEKGERVAFCVMCDRFKGPFSIFRGNLRELFKIAHAI